MGGNNSINGSSNISLVMLGLDQSGKTTILYRLKFNQYTNAVPTVGFNCEKIKTVSGKAKGITFTIWDIGGHDKTRPLWVSYMKSSEGIIFVIDSCDKERMEEAKMELLKLTRCSENSGLPLLILANKQDLYEAMDSSEIEKLLSLHELPQGHLWHLIPVCGITGEGLDEAIDKMFDLLVKRKKSKKKR